MSTDSPPASTTTDPPSDSSGSVGSAQAASVAAEGPNPRGGWWLFSYISAMQLLYVFVLYVLSTGPMYWSIYEAYTMGSSPFLQKLYYPLVKLAEAWPWFSEFLDWWIGLWL